MSAERPLEVTVKPKNSPVPVFASQAVTLFDQNDRIAARAADDGLVLSAVWYADLDVAWKLISSRFSEELLWSEPRILYRDEIVESGGRRRRIVLEPILSVEAHAPADYIGSVIGDLSARRGILTGQKEVEEGYVVSAEVPLAELRGYTIVLDQLTSGRGAAHAKFLRYDKRPPHVGPPDDEPMAAALRA
jgi:Elongation factor G C-terminus